MKKIIKVIMLLSLLTASLASRSVQAETDSFKVEAAAAIAVDSDSGKILYEQNGDKAGQGIASITKLLTVYMVYDAVKSGKLKWDDKVAISDYAYNLTQSSVASNIPMAQGESFTVKDLVNAALIPSANSAAIALAEKISGSEPKFVDHMTTKLKSWGIEDAKLVNSSGLSNADLPEANWYPGTNADSENTMSAKDVAIIATHLITEYPEVLEITKQTSMTFDQGGASENTMANTNYMLPGLESARAGLDGLKTGTTALAGYSFVGTAEQNGFRVITVVLNAEDGSGESSRFTQTDALMNKVFGTWQVYDINAANAPLKGYIEAPVIDGKKLYVPLITDSTFAITTKMENPKYSIKINKAKAGVEAPIKKGETIASAYAFVNDKLGYLPGYNGSTVELIAKESVERANPFVVGWNRFVKFVNEEL
ncbi:MAG: D-alanyl-D-alanine carboxypeptidase [Streptococcaceae bacterium]|jgi:D-alanyl-D-alanine carboxypeptidase (penicillin-binding protein 5/6)|nr:D-alanyl-D-alanine carboxypeptidase [Streptococcaceae bacterium]